MFRNMASWDSLIRLALAAGAVTAYFALSATGWLAGVLLVFAAVMVFTAATRFCPLYRACGIRTHAKDARHGA